jgi:hypothetical protein
MNCVSVFDRMKFRELDMHLLSSYTFLVADMLSNCRFPCTLRSVINSTTRKGGRVE